MPDACTSDACNPKIIGVGIYQNGSPPYSAIKCSAWGNTNGARFGGMQATCPDRHTDSYVLGDGPCGEPDAAKRDATAATAATAAASAAAIQEDLAEDGQARFITAQEYLQEYPTCEGECCGGTDAIYNECEAACDEARAHDAGLRPARPLGSIQIFDSGEASQLPEPESMEDIGGDYGDEKIIIKSDSLAAKVSDKSGVQTGTRRCALIGCGVRVGVAAPAGCILRLTPRFYCRRCAPQFGNR